MTDHYTVGGIESIDVIRAKLTPEQFRGFCLGNAMKYVHRCGHKDDAVADARKAIDYLAWFADSATAQDGWHVTEEDGQIVAERTDELPPGWLIEINEDAEIRAISADRVLHTMWWGANMRGHVIRCAQEICREKDNTK